MAHEPLGAQAVLLVQHGHEEVPGGQVAPHEDVAVPGVDDVDGRLGHVVARRGVHHGVGLVLQPQLLQLHHGTGPVTHQHRLDKALVLGLEQALEHVLPVGARQHHPQGGVQMRDPADDVVKILQFHGKHPFSDS